MNLEHHEVKGAHMYPTNYPLTPKFQLLWLYGQPLFELQAILGKVH